MRRVLAVGMICFLMVLAAVIGQRMSTDAMAVVIGVLFGVAASIPTSLVVLAAARRSATEANGSRPGGDRWPQERWGADRAFPPVIVVAPPAQTASPASTLPPLIPPAAAERRRFRIVGADGEATWIDEGDSDAYAQTGWR